MASTPSLMQITHTIAETRKALHHWESVAFVPTMGALHEGHLSLVRRARALCPRVVVSIFVNPTQFGPAEDFQRYPRPFEEDQKMCREAGVDLLFAPTAEEMYPAHEAELTMDVPRLSQVLEGALRPGHFTGVCRVVAKLLGIVEPQVACFGQKDYQQLAIIDAMTRALCLPVQIVSCPTLRDADGLALSSRNRYLSPEQHKRALGLSKALQLAKKLLTDGVVDPAALEKSMTMEMQAHQIAVDYAVVRDARTLLPVDSADFRLRPVVFLVAGKVDQVRLIDNQLLVHQA